MSIFLEATLKLLDDIPRERWHELTKKVDCTYAWLAQLDDGKISSPGIHKLEKLFKALGGKFSDLND